MRICGNDDKSKKTVTVILTRFGRAAEDMGKAEAAWVIEPLVFYGVLMDLISITGSMHLKYEKQN